MKTACVQRAQTRVSGRTGQEVWLFFSPGFHFIQLYSLLPNKTKHHSLQTLHSSDSLVVGPSMSMTYEDLQSLGSEKKSQRISNGSKIQRDLETLRAAYSNFTSNTEAEVQALRAQGGLLKDMITSLKVEVENQTQQLQAGYSDMVVRVQELAKKLNSLNTQMAELKSNGSQTTCCPVNWLEHKCSCYWFSSMEKPWPEAEEYCQLENAHLVVVSSLEEQKFLEKHTSSVNTWMGLSDLHLVWFWVDWTDIETGFQYWREELQDDWYRNLPVGSGNCVYFSNNGRWFYDICQRPYRWACEKELNKVG
ncbi:asialoglycoprotein receptor 1-like isoform X2 [Desmodus rotundus]|uniref:asialoglycoprotein receptor 1-like isoform X2 n=1 Tax=Desmodus rotundus TaxID=9430 RepID=UPI0023815649|nr:asialoglycoprotein receptor 1-like isoform X2 [Desmodus rotundus]